MSELIAAAQDVGPWFLALLLLLLFAVYAVEKLGGKDGPLTRFGNYLRNRELHALRRQAAIDQERRQMLRDAESETVALLRTQLAALRLEMTELKERQADDEEELRWHRAEANDLRRRDRHRSAWERDMTVWLARNLPRWKAGLPPADEPPLFEPLAAMLVMEDDVQGLDGNDRRPPRH